MNRHLFVTGIGTGVGKTVISALLVKALRYAYWKPLQCGDLLHSDADTIKSLVPEADILKTRYGLEASISPHAAAKLENKLIQLDDFLLPIKPAIIEGAGGVLVPLNHDDLIIDLVPKLNAVVVVVSQYYLGSINHTLLTLNELKRRNLSVIGIIFNGEKNEETKNIILRHHPIPILLELPLLSQMSTEVFTSYAEILRRNIHVHLSA